MDVYADGELAYLGNFVPYLTEVERLESQVFGILLHANGAARIDEQQ